MDSSSTLRAITNPRVLRHLRHTPPARLLAVLWLAVVLIGCGGPATTHQQQTIDGITIALERPTRLELLDEHDMIVTLTDAGGQPVDGATVFFELHMPSMAMGTNAPIADPLGSGRYSAKTLFTMEGDWQVTINASVAGRDHRATFGMPVGLLSTPVT